MAIKAVKLTKEGLKNLEQELEYLKTVKRKEVSETIKVALSFGDLSENSEYDEAKNEQAMVEARVKDLEAILKDVVLVNEDDIDTNSVSVGLTITVKNLKNNRTDTYKLVGSTEAAPLKKRISDESPVGKTLIGHVVGDVVDVEAPNGIVQYEILEITK